MNKVADSKAWQKLQAHSEQFTGKEFSLGELVRNPGKFQRTVSSSIECESLLFDFSRNFFNDETLGLLVGLAEERGLPGAIEAMFAGDLINRSEQQPALHIALREQDSSRLREEVRDTLAAMDRFVASVHSGEWRGYSGETIRDVVNIGIGGSDLGPAMATRALDAYASDAVRLHFVANIDPADLAGTLAGLDPATTLFIVASKSFGTLETLENARAARQWLVQASGDDSAVANHFIAISTNLEAVAEFGIPESNTFPLWDWVGGRFSMWSAIGLPIALAIGMDNFRQLLGGAHAMDRHFAEAPLGENIPVLMGLLTNWYKLCFNAHSQAIVPYNQDLELLPLYLQQMSMESLGKSVQQDGSAVTMNTGPVTWGTTGSNGQHSYFQLLHQGTEFIPVDFVAFARPSVTDDSDRHRHLLANCFGQAMALADGSSSDADPHKRIPGNKPSNMLLFSSLTPHNLGMLIAAYEHKTYVQAVLWNINAFDQWGVELGKKLSSTVYQAFDSFPADSEIDSTTLKFIEWVKRHS